ncbi:MAG: hypothetical protein R3229_05340 [Alphaproteobacteria bacterium]|nr:hypothetical protein [Alphaproteobacteria bacterium]
MNRTTASLADIQVPVLLAHQEDDACSVTPYEDLPALAKAFSAAPAVEIKGYTGGGNYRGSECGARTAHGFRGIERRVVRELAAWIHGIAAKGR